MLKYLLTTGYESVILRFAERESRLMVLAATLPPQTFRTRPCHNSSVFNDSHTLVFSKFVTHSFCSVCTLFKKRRGYTPLLPKTELRDPSFVSADALHALTLSPRPNMPILGELSFALIGFGFDQEGSLS